MTEENSILPNPLDKIAVGDDPVNWRVRTLVKSYLNLLLDREKLCHAEELIRSQLVTMGFDLDALVNKVRGV